MAGPERVCSPCRYVPWTRHNLVSLEENPVSPVPLACPVLLSPRHSWAGHWFFLPTAQREKLRYRDE